MYMELAPLEKFLSDKFRKKHRKKCNSGVFYMVDRSNGIGWSVLIHCKICNKFKDITDVGSW